MNDEKTSLTLMSYRVFSSERIAYKAEKMSKDDIIKRRAEMRKILLGSSLYNCSNDSLDSMRIERTNLGYIIEDCNGSETIINYVLKNTPNNATNTDKG